MQGVGSPQLWDLVSAKDADLLMVFDLLDRRFQEASL
jgi:hypothetical protein